LNNIEIIKGSFNVKVNYTQNGNFERNQLCFTNKDFITKCATLTKSTTILDLNTYIDYGEAYEIEITTYWCDGSKKTTSLKFIERKTGN
jgi:hypothetical protein